MKSQSPARLALIWLEADPATTLETRAPVFAMRAATDEKSSKIEASGADQRKQLAEMIRRLNNFIGGMGQAIRDAKKVFEKW